jgi:hypothetical protein
MRTLFPFLLMCGCEAPPPERALDTGSMDIDIPIAPMAWSGAGAIMSYTSDGGVPTVCPARSLGTGFDCNGSYCDDINLRCKYYTGGPVDSTRVWQSWFSDETPTRLCPADAWLTGLTCKGSYCDELSIECTFTGRTATACRWSAWYSEESPSFYEAPRDHYLHGLECRGRYCDDVRAEYCREL